MSALLRALREAEDALRAEGLTGAQAFTQWVAAVRWRLGDTDECGPAARAVAARLPDFAASDLLGLGYERFFSDLFKAKLGQYFTPPGLVRLVLARLGPAAGELRDPMCGSGAFLVAAGRAGWRVSGTERDPLLADLCRLNLRLAGLEGEVSAADAFAAPAPAVDALVANPPFSIRVRDAEHRLVQFERLFFRVAPDWIRPGGRAAVVVPWSLVANPRGAPERARIEADWRVDAICSLPEGVFRPFGGAGGSAAVLWLRRRPAPPGPRAWASLADPGWDVSSEALRFTDGAELDGLVAGEGWVEIPEGAWAKPLPRPAPGGRAVGELAAATAVRNRPARRQEGVLHLVELADVDRETGEIRGARAVPAAAVRGHKTVLAEGDVLVSRLRPEQGKVAVVGRGGLRPGLGSTEWVALRGAAWPRWLAHSLRAPAWRAQLGPVQGQTHPRTTADAMLAARVAWPGEGLAARIDALSEAAHQTRERERARLAALQAAIDRFSAGEIDAAGLEAVVVALERGSG